MTVRVRFAPSPTGHLHVGGLRATIFNYLFARHEGGKFLVRIEDTDRERSKDIYTQSILEALAWCDIVPDEPIVIQSGRIERHHEVARQLIAAGKAYRCYCTPQELETRLGKSAAEGEGYHVYDRFCFNAPPRDENVSHVVRFHIPTDISEVVVHDLIHGDVTFKVEQLSDAVIIKSDGMPTYNFAVVVDDADMRISHVIRGEEHLVNTPLQILIYRACGFPIPQFAHLPLILAPDGSKLSKREGAVSVVDYKRAGYLPHALCNYLVRLGWSHGDEEIFSREQLIKLFSLKNVGKKGAIFDLAKLGWMNTVYLKQHSGAQLLAIIRRDLDPQLSEHTAPLSEEQRIAFADLYKERVTTLLELVAILVAVAHGAHEHIPIPTFDTRALSVMDHIARALHQEAPVDRVAVELLIKRICTETGVPLSAVGPAVRYALTSSVTSPSMYDLVMILGPLESARRMRALDDRITSL